MEKKREVKKLRLRDARTLDELCSIRRDNMTVGDFWILSDGYQVTLAHQKNGESAKASITIPRPVFNRMIDMYMRPQKVRTPLTPGKGKRK